MVHIVAHNSNSQIVNTPLAMVRHTESENIVISKL